MLHVTCRMSHVTCLILNAYVEKMDERVFELEKQNESLSAKVLQLEQENASLKMECVQINREAHEARKHAINNEQYSRKSNLKIIGLPEHDAENCRKWQKSHLHCYYQALTSHKNACSCWS